MCFLQTSRSILYGGTNFNKCSEGFENFLFRMRDDDVTRRIKSDPILMRYGSSIYMRKDGDGFNDFSQRLRAASKLLGALRIVFEDPSLLFMHAMECHHWQKWVDALTSFSADHSLLLRIGHVLQSMFPFVRGYLLRKRRSTTSLTEFEQLYR